MGLAGTAPGGDGMLPLTALILKFQEWDECPCQWSGSPGSQAAGGTPGPAHPTHPFRALPLDRVTAVIQSLCPWQQIRG